jgi:hypothetical protein
VVAQSRQMVRVGFSVMFQNRVRGSIKVRLLRDINGFVKEI